MRRICSTPAIRERHQDRLNWVESRPSFPAIGWPTCANNSSEKTPSPDESGNSLDHLIGAAEQRERDRETERIGGFGLDQLDFRG